MVTETQPETPTESVTPEDDITIVVVDTDEPTEPAIDAGDTTVIVAPPVPPEPSDDSSPVSPVSLDHESRITALEVRLDEVAARVTIAEFDAEIAGDLASIALDATDELAATDDAIVAAVDEADAEIIENVENAEEAEDGEGFEVDPIEPASAKIHPLFRPASEWFGKGK